MGKQNTFDFPDNYTWFKTTLAITKAHFRWCYRKRRKSNLFLKVDKGVLTCRWNFWIRERRVHWFRNRIKAGHWFITWYIFTDIISEYFTDSGLERKHLLVYHWFKSVCYRNCRIFIGSCSILFWINSFFSR